MRCTEYSNTFKDSDGTELEIRIKTKDCAPSGRRRTLRLIAQSSHRFYLEVAEKLKAEANQTRCNIPPCPPKSVRDDRPFAKVKIISEDGNSIVYLDDKKVNGLIGYELVHDRTKAQIPILRLNIQAQLNIETGAIPELPEPWNLCYVLKSERSEKETS